MFSDVEILILNTFVAFPIRVGTDRRHSLQMVLSYASSLFRYPNHFHIMDVV